MPFRSSQIVRPILALGLLIAFAGPSVAQSGSVSLDKLSFPVGDQGAILSVPHVDVTGTNLSRDEVAALFSPQMPKAQVAAILQKMQAQKFSVPAVSVAFKEGQFSLRNFEATNISAGHVEHVGFVGGDGSGKDNKGNPVTVTIGALDVVDADFSSLFEALRSGDLVGRQVPAKSFLWKGADVSVPDGETPATAPGGNLVKIAVGPLSVESTYKDRVPLHAVMDWKSFSVTLPPESKAAKAMAQFGYSSLGFAMHGEATYDPVRKSYRIDDIAITSPKAGTIDVKMEMNGIGPEFLNGGREAKIAAIMQARLMSLSLAFADDGLFDKVVRFVASEQKKQPDALKREWSSMATQFIPMGLGGDPASLKIAEAVAKFIASPGNLTLSVQAKGEAPKLDELKGLTNPMAVLKYYQPGAVYSR